MSLSSSLSSPSPRSRYERAQGLIVEELSGARIGPVSFALAPGGCVALMGPSGAGKTLLLRQVVDLDPGSGHVVLDGKARETYAAPEWRRRVMLVPAVSGWWASTVAAHFPDEALAEASRLCVAMRLPEDILERNIVGLSTGERQRLALVRALVAKPDVLLLDEPTSGLDADAALAVEGCLKDVQRGGTAMLIVTHDPVQAARLASTIHRIEDGTLRTA
ncbi:phosphate-transporting ATPase [Luteibacter sp. UNCMF331Sha3.1]|uniref:ABC transporter ATP-binding protein n=1 Tax=Luteibacter sp. UNCMF331Sha3.1 TaxID=1502760 RepID=UPI0008BAE3A1|nr:ABC transporter ATP-binding protein [Luteibacter sp. UNCMF331Sha3.1]SEM54701.1 phosphate-transporting ATPase [Luteibacter sp. UNCMF331Sha3.1]